MLKVAPVVGTILPVKGLKYPFYPECLLCLGLLEA